MRKARIRQINAYIGSSGTQEPLAEGLDKVRFKTEVLDGKTFVIPLDGHGNRNWKKLSDEQLIEFTRLYCKQHKIKKIGELYRKLHGLVNILRARNLMIHVFKKRLFEEVTLGGKIFKIPLDGHGNRNWQAMSDDEIIEYSKAYCSENRITRISKLKTGSNKDIGLLNQLQRRKLIDRVVERKSFEEVTLQCIKFKIPLDNKQGRNWSKMSDAEIIAFAKAYCKEKGITKSYELQKGPNKDNCLSSILYKRKLMDKVFSSIKAEQEVQQLESLANALESFGGSGK